MLNSPTELSKASVSALSRVLAQSGMDDWNLDRVLGIAARQKWRIIGTAAVCVLLALAYSFLATPKYTAIGAILVETPRVSAVADAYDGGQVPFTADSGMVDSQIEVMQSERVALAVIKKLRLTQEESFQPSYIPVITPLRDAIAGTISWIKSLLGAEPPDEAVLAYQQQRAVVEALLANLDVKRVARSLVVDVKFTWKDADLAAKIVNGFMEEYLNDQLNSKFEATQRATIWLQDRNAELREKALTADLAVQSFRSKNGLFAIDGTLVDEQQLSSANSQLSDARAKVAEAEARFDRIQSIIKSGNADQAVTEALVNPVVAGLRTRYVEVSKREQDITAKLGPNHIQAVNLRADMKQYEKLLFEELNRIGESYRSDLQIAQTRFEAAEKNLKDLMSQAAINNQTLVELRELERTSDTYKTLYQTFLQRYQQAAQTQSFPIVNARVITEASVPLKPSAPKKPIIISLGLIAGLGLGVGFATLREMKDRSFRTGEQIAHKLGLEFLGLVPKLPGDEVSRMRYVLDNPLSSASETLRAIKVTADLALRGKRPKIIGVCSVVPGEGKTSITKNLASMVAHLGARTVLLDGDMRNSGLSRVLCPNVTNGLAQVLTGTVTAEQAELIEKESGLHFIPSAADHNLTNTNELLASSAMQQLLDNLASRSDYIIVDLPPIGPVIDVRAAADLFDAFVCVVEWGETPQTLVKSTLAAEPEIMSKCIGVVLNKVDMKGMRLYQRNEFRNYSLDHYSVYHDGRAPQKPL